jgi:hypothetical protein
MIATGSNGPELWNQPLIVQPTVGWQFTPAPTRQLQRIVALQPDQAELYNPPKIIQPQGWTIEAPTFRRQTKLGPSLINISIPASATGDLGWTIEAQALPRQRVGFGPSIINVSIPASGTAVQPISGWEFQQPALVRHRTSQDPDSSDGTPPILAQIAAPPQSGWTIVLPELRRTKPAAALAALDSLSLPLSGPPQPQGANVSLAELKQVKPRVGFADASIAPEAWSPLRSVATQPWGWSLPPPQRSPVHIGPLRASVSFPPPAYALAGWQAVLPDLYRAPRIVALQPDQAELYNPPAPTVTTPVTGWEFQQPTLARRQTSADPEGGDASPNAIGPVAAPPQSGWTITLPELQPKARRDLTAINFRFDPSLTVAVGWTVEPAIIQRRPTVSGALTGGTLAPQAINPVAVGWSIVLPDLRLQSRSASFQPDQAELYSPPSTPFGWTVTLPELAQRKRQVPDHSFRADQPITATAATGWQVTLPDLLVTHRQAFPYIAAGIEQPGTLPGAVNWSTEPPVTRRRPTTIGALAGADLPSESINLEPWGWSVVLPDLPQFVRRQALPEATGRIDQAAPQPFGWDVVTPDLPWARRVPALTESLPRLDQVQQQPPFGWQVFAPNLAPVRRVALPENAPVLGGETYPWGWSVTLPEIRVARVPGSGAPDTAGRIDQPTQAFPWGWSVVLPDFPAARRYQALPEYTARIDFVTPTTTVVWGWQGDQPTIRRAVSGTVAETSVLPLTSTSVAVGWDVVTPDLPQFKRVQALPESAGRIDQPATLQSATSLGWLAELPALRASPPPRAGVLVGPALAPQTVTSVAVGWSIVLPDLRSARRYQALPEATGRIDQATPPVTWGWQVDAFLPAPRRLQAQPEGVFTPLGGETFPSGWSIVTPELRRAQPPSFAGGELPAQTIITAAQTGWSIVLPDLPAGRRYQALPEGQGRLDQPVTIVGVVFAEGWQILPPDIRVQPRTAGVLAGADLPPTAPQQQPFGATLNTPELPQFRRKSAVPETASGRLDAVQSQPFGWDIVLPDLPQAKRKQALPESTGRLDRPTETADQWSVRIPDLPWSRRKADVTQALPRLDAPLAQPTGWTITQPDLSRAHARLAEVPQASLSGSTSPWGWSIVLPDLPRVQRPDLTWFSSRLDFVPTVTTVLWWVDVTPDSVGPRRTLGTLAGADLPLSAQPQPFGWSVALPDLPRFRRVSDVSETLPRLDQPQVQPYGWTVTQPDLPSSPHRDLSVVLGRLDPTTAAVTVQFPNGWTVEPPYLSRIAVRAGGVFAGAEDALAQIAPSTAVVTAEQTYFIGNMGRMMGRRG